MTYTLPSSIMSLSVNRYSTPSDSKAGSSVFSLRSIGLTCEYIACACKMSMASASFFRPLGDLVHAITSAFRAALTASTSNRCKANIPATPLGEWAGNGIGICALSQSGESPINSIRCNATRSTGGSYMAPGDWIVVFGAACFISAMLAIGGVR